MVVGWAVQVHSGVLVGVSMTMTVPQPRSRFGLLLYRCGFGFGLTCPLGDRVSLLGPLPDSGDQRSLVICVLVNYHFLIALIVTIISITSIGPWDSGVKTLRIDPLLLGLQGPLGLVQHSNLLTSRDYSDNPIWMRKHPNKPV